MSKKVKEPKIVPAIKPVKVKRKKPRKKKIANTSLVAVNPQRLILKAIEKDLDLDKMERILAMRKDLKDEFAKDEYFRNLALFQKDCPIIEKTTPVYEKNSKKVRYMYAKIESIIKQVKIVLERYGFSYNFLTKQESGNFTTICNSYHKTGHQESTEFTVPIDMESYMSDPQKVASASTFAKRYAFCNAFGIATESEDNDANTTEPENKKMTEQQKKEMNRKYGYDYKKKSGSKIKNTGEEKNITNISDYKEVKPDNSKKVEEIKKKTIELLNSKKKDGERVFSGEEMIKNKRAIDHYIAENKIGEALNAIDVIEAIHSQRVGEKNE